MSKEILLTLQDLLLQLGFKITEKEVFAKYVQAYEAINDELKKIEE